MYSDFLESPSTDCFSFNDQSSSCDMAEMNEISNQTNLDYIFDSYYSSVSRYNTGFELPEDCKNMSFSELFDQELFSTHENKDCKITIKIEKEEPIQPCYSTDNSLVTDSQGLVNIEEHVSTSSASKSFAPNRGINRTSIKATENYDVKHLIYNPFCETEDLGIDQTSVKTLDVKCEPEDISEINKVDTEIKSCYSADDLQKKVGSHNLLKIKSNKSFSPAKKSSTLKHQSINRTSFKTTTNCDVEPVYNSFCKTEDLDIDHATVEVDTSIVKSELEDISDTVVQKKVGMESKTRYIDNNLQNINTCPSLVKIKNDVSSSKKSSTTKRIDICRNAVKNTKNCNLQHNKIKHCGKTSEVLDKEKIPVKFDPSTVKQELEDIGDTFDQNIIRMKVEPSSIDLQNTFYSHNSVKVEDNVASSSPISLVPKRRSINKTFKNCDLQPTTFDLFCETQDLGIKQIPAEVDKCILIRKPEDINNIYEQNIVEIKSKPNRSAADSPYTTDNHSVVKIEDNIPSSLLKDQGINYNLTKSSDVQQTMFAPFCKTEDLINQMSVKIKTSIIQRRPEEVHDIIERSIAGMDVSVDEDNIFNVEESKYVHSNEFCYAKLNYRNINCEEIVIKKENDLVTEETLLKNDNIDSLSDTNRNETSLETEKKKISWEEYRAKRGKMGLLKPTEIIEEPVTDLTESDNGKLKAIIEEFDRNTAEHFIGQKRKIETKESNNIVIKEETNEEDQELEKKRMKIEYIKKLLPSSFASEIAKTSSLMKGSLAEDLENESTSDDSILSNKTQGKYIDENLGYPKKDDKFLKKSHQTKVYSSYRNSLRSDYSNTSRSSSSVSSNPDDYYNRNRKDTNPDDYYNRNRIEANPEDYYNRNRIDAPHQSGGQYGQNVRNAVPRTKDQKRVVYVGQIPIKLGKRYLHNRFKEFGTIQSLTLHKKPDFRVYYAFVTYSEHAAAEYAIAHGNDDETQVKLDIRFGERKQTLTPYYDLDDEWLTDWYQYNNQPVAEVRTHSPEKASFEEELQEFYKLAQIKKLNQIKSSQVS